MKKYFSFLAVLLFYINVNAGEWNVDTQNENEVRFLSHTVTLIKDFEFEGITDNIDGYLYWEDDSLFLNNELYFVVDLNTFETGIKKRDQDMREVVLETAKWQTTNFTGKIVHFEKMDTTVTAYRVNSKGKLSLHGVEKEIEVPGKIIFHSGNIRVQAGFGFLITDYKIEVPSILVAKVAEKIKIKLDFYLLPVNN